MVSPRLRSGSRTLASHIARVRFASPLIAGPSASSSTLSSAPPPPPPPYAEPAKATAMSNADVKHLQDEVHAKSISDPESFWMHQAEQLHWHKKPDRALKMGTKKLKSGASHPTWEWFPGGQISTSYNCLDRHVLAGRGNQPAVYYDSPVTRTKRTITYSQLLEDVEIFAAVLREQGVKKGDVVLIYMPQVPAAVTAMMASNRVGAAHCIVFGGFSGVALAQRIDAVKPSIILTASCGIDGTKPPIPYRPLVLEALKEAQHKTPRVIVYQREQVPWPINQETGERSWQELWYDAKVRGVKQEAIPVDSSDPCYIAHTSGTTGAPKGVVRDSAGHAVGLHLSSAMVFGVPGPGGVIFAASDIGWVLGHAWIIHAPLLVGAATVLYEGKPVGTPDSSAFWRIISEYKVTMMYCAPTALRAIKRDDPQNRFLREYGDKGGLRSLKGLFLAGERSEPSLITMYQEILNRYAAPGAQCIDNWWSTETGSPITSRTLMPHAGFDRKTKIDNHPPALLKPGSAGKVMPGFNLKVVDDDGKEVAPGDMGNIVLGLPLAPTAMRTLWEDEERFYKGYLKRFGGELLDTGDAGYIDKDGYVHVMARNDDVLNVSAHRLSSAAIEQAIASHPLVAEGCVVSIPDALKGELPFAFVTLSVPDHPRSAIPDKKLEQEIQNLVRGQVGAIASLGGIIQGTQMIPKTRSGKTLRRVLRELLANAVEGDFDAAVSVPSTVEDANAVEVSREKIREYFKARGDAHKAVHERAKL